MRSFFAVGLLLSSWFSSVLGMQCNADNCLRGLKGSPSSASAFCATYTASSNTKTTGVPAYVSNCRGSSSRISSACSCFAAAATSTSSSTTVTTMTTGTSTSTPANTCPAASTITLPASTVTLPPPPASTSTITTTITIPPSTFTLPSTALTDLQIDYSGCPAIDGDIIRGYKIQCNTLPDPSSFVYYRSNPGYNIEDCSSQCFDVSFIDCLAVTYTPPAQVVSLIDGTLQAGSYTFYEFVNYGVPTPGVHLAQYVGIF